MRGATWQSVLMSPLGGEELRDARVMAGYPGKAGRAAFAALVGVSPRTVEGWEAKGGRVSGGREALVRKALAGQGAATLEAASNMDLLSVLATRLAWYEGRIAELEAQLGLGDETNYPPGAERDNLSPDVTPGATRRKPVQGIAGPSIPRKPRRNDAN